jgi:foldase protein PrsA
LAKTPEKTIRSDCSTLFTSLSGQVMDFLIKAYWYQADAAKAHITITDAQVQTAFDAAKKQQFPTPAQFQTLLSSSGLTLQDILFRVRVDQIYMKLIAKHPTTVSAAQIQAYYSSHLAQFQTAESRNIRIVLTKTRATALAAKSALRKGSSWSAVAKRYSTDPTTKSKGGLLVGVTQGQQDQALNSAAFSAPANKLLGPVHGQFGFYVFEVTKITKATTRTLALASATIKQTLTTQLQSSAQTAVDSHAKKDWLHRTTCRKPYAMADCNGFKAPAASTTATAPSTATAPPTATATTAPPTATTPSTATSSTTK